jgi:hypothetical protein
MKVKKIPPISIKDNHLSPQTIEHKKSTKYGVVNPCPDLRQAQTCDRVKLVNEIPTLSL